MEKQRNRLIINTYKNFKTNLKSLLYFEILYKIIAMFLIIPLNYFILKKFLGNVGMFNLTNKDILKFGFSVNGMIFIGVILVISFIAVFIEMGILTYMANKSHLGKKVSLLEGTVNTFRILPKTIGFNMLFLVLISGVVGPLLGIGLYSSLIRKLSIPSFIQIELFKTFGGKVLFFIFIGILIVLLLRWILSIPAMIIENVKLRAAFKNSIKIYKESKFKILFYVILWLVVNFFIKAILLILYFLLGVFILSILGTNTILSGIFTGIYILLFFIVYVIISVITLPLFISFLVELYYEFRNYEVEEREFKAIKEYEENRVYLFIQRNKKYFNYLVVIIFSIIVSVNGVAAIFDNVIDKDIKVTAHRGSSLTAPENSLSSIINAIEEGADYAEIDVMTTKDNKVVLFHDSNLKRIDGSNRSIKDMTLDQVKQVNNGSYFSDFYSDEKIPTLEEVFEISKGKIKLNIELKPYGEGDTLPVEVSKLIEEHDMEGEVVVTSIDYEVLQEFKSVNPFVRVGYILTFGLGDFTKLDVDFLSIEYQLAKKELIYGMHALSKEVHVWTVNDEDRVDTLSKLGVDNIITDSVPTVNEALEKNKHIEDFNFETWFFESIKSIIKYVQI
ncbi:MAG: glycerophosphoryl diester phosphodiesterase membrane domain-containing protein [Clostridium sp.]